MASEFSRNSAWDDQRARESRESDREFAQRVEVPVRTPEENQRIAASIPKTANIPVRDLEGIVDELRQVVLANDIEDSALERDLADLADRLSSYFPG